MDSFFLWLSADAAQETGSSKVALLFPQKLFSLDAMREATLKEYYSRYDDTTIQYLTYGAYRIICMWLCKEQRESSEQIAKLLASFIKQQH